MSGSTHRAKAFEEFEHECSLCDVQKENNLEVHHIDGDPTNDSTENLLIVCKSCHGDIHSGEIEEWSEKILPRDERRRRVTYLMEPATQKRLELIMHVADVDSEKEAIAHAVREYQSIYDTLQASKSELPSELIETRRDATLNLSKSVESVLEQHIESSELVEEIRKDMAEVIAERLFNSKIPVPEK